MREMTPEEARAFVAHNHLGILCLAGENGGAYGVPLYYATDGRAIYFHTRPGTKQRYVVETREACFTIVRVIAADDWASVMAFGPIQRIEPSLAAQDALMAVPLPPEWGEGALGEPERSARDLAVYKLDVKRLTGRYSRSAGTTSTRGAADVLAADVR